jgi:succinyl-diaminopimelate desuccinylase
LANQLAIEADAAIVMESAAVECPIAQLGSATFEITIRREGEPSHQLHTPTGTPHPITVAADVIQALGELNEALKHEYIEDIGHASYFVGSVHSGQFYNQHPSTAQLVGVRRYSPSVTFQEVETELRAELDRIAAEHGVEIDLRLEKVRDGYRIDKNGAALGALVAAIRKVRGIDPPLVGKKIVTDASIFVNQLGITTLCHGPDQRTAHADVEYVAVDELIMATGVYLQFIAEYMGKELPDHDAIAQSGMV